MNSFDKLKGEGFVREKRRLTGCKIKITEKGQKKIKSINKNISERKKQRIKNISEKFGGKTGKELEKSSLDYLNISPEKKEEFIGNPVEVIITEEWTLDELKQKIKGDENEC